MKKQGNQQKRVSEKSHIFTLVQSILLITLFVACETEVTELAALGDRTPTATDTFVPNPSPGGGDGDSELNLGDVQDSFTQNQAQQRKVDILWVIDNSGSMGGDQARLSNSFSSFIERFLAQPDIPDFSMFFTSTDPRESKPFGHGKLNQGLTGTPTITLADFMAQGQQLFQQEFTARIRGMGTNGSGQETSTAAALWAVQRNSEVLRENSELIVIMLSDENDSSVGYTGQSIESLVNQLRTQSARSPMIHSIVNSRDYGRYDTRGRDQEIASELTNGNVYDIKEDFSDSLSNLGQSIVDLLDSFVLSKQVYNATEIIVTVNGEQVNSGWSFNSDQNTIRFEAGQRPEEGAVIQVSYRTLLGN